VLLDARANLYLIDNDKALSGAPNSIFLPQTLHHVFTYYGRPYVSSRGVEPLTRPSPLAQLDYRCHTENESRQIGREYPSRFKQCLRNLHFMDVEGIMSAYGGCPAPRCRQCMRPRRLTPAMPSPCPRATCTHLSLTFGGCARALACAGFQSRSRAALLKERAGKLFAVRFEEAMAEMAPQSPTCRCAPAPSRCLGPTLDRHRLRMGSPTCTHAFSSTCFHGVCTAWRNLIRSHIRQAEFISLDACWPQWRRCRVRHTWTDFIMCLLLAQL